MKLPRFLTRLSAEAAKSAGFTMIELLVVISVIGVLAVAVLSSINPIEQINKGRDTRTRSDAAQIINAVERYFATHEFYPWNTDSSSGSYDAPVALEAANAFQLEFEYDSTANAGTVADFDWIDTLVDTAEVKAGFTNRLKDEQKLFMYKGNDSNATIYSCFLPQSESFKLEAAKKCQNNETPEDDPDWGGSITICQTTDGTIDDNNYLCLP